MTAPRREAREWTLAELAREVGGEVEGDPSVRIRDVAGIQEAGPGEITFLSNPRYLTDLEATRASAVILAPGVPVRIPAVRCDNPYAAFARIAVLLRTESYRPRGVSPDLVCGEDCRLGRDLSIHPRVVLGDRVRIGDRVTLHPGVVVGDDCEVGDDTVLYAGVTLREGVRIGRRVIVHNGAVIGSDGFGFALDRGRYVKIPQTGGVRVGDDVEIGANTTVDRGTLGDTVIGRGTKIDNLVQIAHNVRIGEDCIIVAQAGISGSTAVGDRVTLAGQAGLAGHLRIGAGVTVAARAGVTKDVPAGRVVAGFPALPLREWRKAAGSFVHLPAMRKALKALEARMAALERRTAGGEEDDGHS